MGFTAASTAKAPVVLTDLTPAPDVVGSHGHCGASCPRSGSSERWSWYLARRSSVDSSHGGPSCGRPALLPPIPHRGACACVCEPRPDLSPRHTQKPTFAAHVGLIQQPETPVR